MKKLLAFLTATVILLLALAGCGSSSSAPAETDPQALADELINSLAWDSTMEAQQEKVLQITFGLPDDSSAVGYFSDGTTAEAVVCITCADTDAAQAGVQSYLEEQSRQMSQYFPEEVERVENAVTEVSGDTVVLVITGDPSGAEAILADYFG